MRLVKKDDSFINFLGFVTKQFILLQFLVFLRQEFGRRNLAKKTLVDKRFLI